MARSADLARRVLLSTIAFSGPAMAQATDTATRTLSTQVSSDIGGNSGAPEIIVTANKRAESINKVPLTVVAVSGERLTAMGIRDVADLTRAVPGFVAVPTQLGAPSYFIRGVGYYSFSFAGKPTVTLYEDEAPLPYPAMAIGSNLDLARLEVLKGPQGTLFGSNSTGGAINFIAAKPTDVLSGGFGASIGRFNDTLLTGFVSGPLSGTTSLRLAVSHEGRGDWQRSYTTNATLGSRDVTTGRASMNFSPSDSFSALLTFEGARDRSDSQAGQFVDGTGGRAPVQAYPHAPADARAADWDEMLPLGMSPKRDNYQLRSTLRTEYKLSGSTALTSLTSYTYNRQRFGQDTDGTTLHITDYYATGHLSSFYQELRASGVVGAGGKWVVGGNYEKDESKEDTYSNSSDSVAAHAFDALGIPLGTLFQAEAKIKDRSAAAFANLDYDLSHTITMHGGIRYTDTLSTFSGCPRRAGNGGTWLGLAAVLRLSPDLVPLGGCFVLQSVNGALTPVQANLRLQQNNVSWRGGIDWKPVTGTLLYASVSRGYKAGQFANIAAVFVDQYSPVPQEKLTAYELGFKSRLLPGLLQVNGALFHYDYENKQVQGRKNVPIFGFQVALVSVPKSKVDGAELEITLTPARGLTLSGSATYVKTKILGSFVSFTTFGVQQQLGGSSFPFTPHLQANAGAEYRWPVSSTLGAFAGTNLTYRSRANGDFVQNPVLDINAYTLLDLRAGLETRDGRWRFEAYGRNITNKYYWTSVLRSAQNTYRLAGLPTTYGVSIGYKF